MDVTNLADSLNAFENVDISEFQRNARMLQSIWREQQGYTCGVKTNRGKESPLGSRLPMPWAKNSLANFLTEKTKNVVRSEVLNSQKSTGKLYGKPRIFNDLLSSQPLCFNLFAELTSDLRLISHVIDALTNGRFSKVTAIDFEYSPGRGDLKYLGDRSAFDVFLECETSAGEKGFIGIEIKYHENLKGRPGEHRKRYDEVAELMSCFDTKAHQDLRKMPLQQIWRDHLLAGVLALEPEYSDGLFVILYPKDNIHVSIAVEDYRSCLVNDLSFASWTLEDFYASLATHSGDSAWLTAFYDRYLDFNKVRSRLHSDLH